MTQRRTLHTNKRGNTPKVNNNYQPICTQLHQIYTKGFKNKHRPQHSGSERQVIPTKNQQRNPRP
jgi:hypothetical protein